MLKNRKSQDWLEKQRRWGESSKARKRSAKRDFQAVDAILRIEWKE
jgi:hypothetical protein